MSCGAPLVLDIPRTLCAVGAVSTLADELDALRVRRPLLVTDKGISAAGLVKKVTQAYDGAHPMTLFDEVTENPVFSDVDKGLALYARQSCDGVVALGGGSVIDTAKFIALVASNAGGIADFAGKPGTPHGASAPLIAIPTTAGTGSEASHSAAIHADATAPAMGMSSRHLIPRVAILDPLLTVGLPARLTAATGIDALSHCIEGYLSTKDQPLGKSIALDGIARVGKALKRALADPQDLDARMEMMLAAYAGGVSISMGLGPAHAVALACSDQGFHHGVLSGIGLVATLDATAAHVPERMAPVAQALGMAPTASPAAAIAGLMRELGLPATLAELGYAAGDIPHLANAACRSHFNLFAPLQPTSEQYAAMLSASLAMPLSKISR
ncbi:iron-containing alcohol dehydrogenase [Pusillimonas sp.]|uniref:iron-containing alcohol dehydrogenase n=1 Tax=Pusillimonas sp. TaxID=3040095 RepID=UPI0037CBA2EA